MRRAAVVVGVLAIAAVAVYWFALRGSSTPEAQAQPARPVAQIGEGKQVLVVGSDGKLLGAATGKKAKLPVLPLSKRPTGDHVRGHVLEEVRVIAAAPSAFRPYLAKASWGGHGVTIELSSGIDIRFGTQSEAGRKWSAAAAVLADPSVTLLSYVDVESPTRPSVKGTEHELPPVN